MMRTPPAEILGKTITAVVIKYHPEGSPKTLCHLVFSDNTSIEICLTNGGLRFGGGLDGEGLAFARRYMTPPKGKMEIYYQAALTANGEVLENTFEVSNDAFSGG